MGTRLLLSAVAGIVVAGLASACAWNQTRYMLHSNDHFALEVRHERVVEALAQYHATKGQFPDQLAGPTWRGFAE